MQLQYLIYEGSEHESCRMNCKGNHLRSVQYILITKSLSTEHTSQIDLLCIQDKNGGFFFSRLTSFIQKVTQMN